MTDPKSKKRGKNGGKRAGAGRPKGAASKANELIRMRVAMSGEETPLEFMLKVMRDQDLPLMIRYDAAKSAAPYCHSKMIAVAAVDDPDKLQEINRIERAIVYEGSFKDVTDPDAEGVPAAH